MSLTSAFAQQVAPGAPFSQQIKANVSASQAEESKLTKFSLDFHGGTPQQLVTAIEKAMKKPLNVIIPPEHADFQLGAIFIRWLRASTHRFPNRLTGTK